MTNPLPRNSSVLARLLEELSWVGATIRDYRNGGRGYENVLTAETLQALDFLPRRAFLGAVLDIAHGADAARTKLISEIEEARFTLLPGNQPLIPSGDRHQTQLPVQPDGIIESPNTYTILEAKRIRKSSFQPEQLSREYVLALRDAGPRTPILLLILGSAPPVSVTKNGKLSLPEAVSLYLDHVVCWVTWHEISTVVQAQCDAFRTPDLSLKACINRLASSVTAAIDWHGHNDS
jgi:hypothetical protein